MPTFTKDQFTAVRADLVAACDLIAQKHGLKSLAPVKCVHDTMGGFTYQVTGAVEGGLTRDEQLYESLRLTFPTLPALGTQFVQGRRTFKIIGANSTGSRVIVAEQGVKNETGRQFNYRTQDVPKLVAIGAVPAPKGGL